LDRFFPFDGEEERSLQVLWEDGGHRVFCRGRRLSADGHRLAVLAVLPAVEHPPPDTIDRLAHEYGLRDELDGGWAVRPLELVRERGRTMLVLEDPGGELLEGLLGQPMAVGPFLHLALGLVAAIARLHQLGLIHKDIKPAHILVDRASGAVRLTGFGIASRLPRERQAPGPPAVIAGTLAYMAPEQTGRMNRSIDARSDLYAVGVTLYQMLTGTLPFIASDPMEWVHCHIARWPVPPAERLPGAPAALSTIIMKLLAKTAEERYQTAAGLTHDLRRCLVDWEAGGHIDEFPLGEHDTPDRLLIPEKLYGREREVEALLAAFKRVVESGAPELVLVSGYSGIGKSSVVNELHKVLVPPRGLFAAGKFDQYKRDIPYSTVAQAFQSLVRPLLAKSDTELSGWRDALREALGPNAQLMVDLVSELRLIIGEQPPVPELPPQDAQRRFQLVLRRFIGVFARPEHPLALFLDDLQWLDAATLELLEDLLTRSELRHLLLIGAYRDNEVDAAHPLRHTLAAIRQAGTSVQDITLAPLARDHLGRMIADALHCDANHVAPLADLVRAKTAGNPFSVIQFLSALAEEDLLRFEHDAGRWGWDLVRIEAKAYTDNVVDLLVGRLHRLPLTTRVALKQLACLGNSATIRMLAIVLGTVEAQVHADLWEAVRQELVLLFGGTCKFVHDRVQEAAYSLIPEASRAAAHLRIGRLLVAHTQPEQREEAIFEIVSQLNRGAALISEPEEREQLAELNLLAGKRAKGSMAYASALTYLTTGAALLAKDCWNRRHELAFALELNQAECEFLTGARSEAEARLAQLSSRAADTVKQATVACLRIDLYVTLSQSERAIAVGLEYLRHQGIDWSPHPAEEEARREYERIRSWLGSQIIEDLVHGPLMTDPESLATVDVLTKIAMPAAFTDVNLYVLVISRVVNLSLERGHSDGSCFAYESLLSVAGGYFGEYNTAFRFARLGYDLIEQRGLRRFPARIYVNFGNCLSWTRHVRAGRDMLRRAFDTANTMGDLTYVALASYSLTSNLLAAGDSLIEVQSSAEQGLALAQQMQFGLVVDIASTQLAFVRTLRGLTSQFGSFDDLHFDERSIEHRFSRNPDLARAECWYWIRRAQAQYYAGDFATAVAASARARRLLWTTLSNLERAEHYFYAGLAHAASADSAAGARQQHIEALGAHHRQIQIWAEHCPETFENRAALVGAEIARLEGRDLDAERLYEQAIRSARANGFVHNEALAYEVAARFYAGRGFDEIARLYLRNARYCYVRWGADGKVRQLDQLYPQLRENEPAPGPTHTFGAPVEHLDLATVLKVSQAVSGEIELEKMLDTLMRTAIEQAGAERGLLIVSRENEQRIAAEAMTSAHTVVVRLTDQPMTATSVPEAIVQTVTRTRQTVILGDAAAEPALAADPHIRQRQVRSVLCLPLIKQEQLIGVLYLENNLAPGVFTSARTSVLRLVASQAAIALENTRLYHDLAEREAKIRRLVDANIIGIIFWEHEGPILEANDAFLRIVGYDREDLLAGRLRWIDLTPPEWRAVHERSWTPEIRKTGRVQPYEKEYFRKDGSRVPVLVGATSLNETGSRGVSFVLDLTERKQAEQALHQAQAQLTHLARVMTVGELTASIAHEVNQPLAALATDSSAGLRWLAQEPPRLDEARACLQRAIRQSHRASDVITRVRSLIKKSLPVKTGLDLNDAIQEVLSLIAPEARRHAVLVQAALADGLPPVRGDRVQLQQVILNLAMNGIDAMKDVTGRPRELWIRSHTHEVGSVLVAVEDTGIGLEAESHERVFEAFYTTKAEGMGMGLSISRSIIAAHGGRLWPSANDEHGATFQFTLPTEDTSDRDTAEVRSGSGPAA
jgi:PAS domain S-box-containing protein